MKKQNAHRGPPGFARQQVEAVIYNQTLLVKHKELSPEDQYLIPLPFFF